MNFTCSVYYEKGYEVFETTTLTVKELNGENYYLWGKKTSLFQLLHHSNLSYIFHQTNCICYYPVVYIDLLMDSFVYISKFLLILLYYNPIFQCQSASQSSGKQA